MGENAAENDAPEWLPSFPVDDAMLDRLDHATGTCWTFNDDGERVHHGGDYTLPELLDFLSGYDPALAIPTGTAPGLFGDDVEWSEYPFPTYHEHDVIRALVAEVRRLRDEAECEGPQSCECRCHDEADRCPRCVLPPAKPTPDPATAMTLPNITEAQAKQLLAVADQIPFGKRIQHDHAERIEGCFRCDLSADEPACKETQRPEAGQ